VTHARCANMRVVAQGRRWCSVHMYVYACMYRYTCMYMHACIMYVRLCVCTHTYIHVYRAPIYMHHVSHTRHTRETYMHIYMCTHMHIYVCTYMHIYMCTYMHIYMCTHMHIYMCTYMHIYTCTECEIHACIHHVCVFECVNKADGGAWYQNMYMHLCILYVCLCVCTRQTAALGIHMVVCACMWVCV